MQHENNPIAQAAYNKIAEKYKQHSELLKQNTHASNRVFKEKDFVVTFLPYFCGEATDGMDVAIDTWIKIAGSINVGVNLVDDFGNVLAVVPPLANPQVIDPGMKNTISVGNILVESKAKASISPIAGINSLVGGFLDKIDHSINKESIVNHYQQWQTLMSRYGKTLPISISSQPDVVEKTSSSEDDFTYE